MRNHLLICAVILATIFSGANECQAESTYENLKSYLVSRANFEESELSKIDNSEIIAKLLPTNDKREVAILGLIPIRSSLDLGLKNFQDSMSRQNSKSILKFGSISNVPTIEDFRSMTLDDSEIEELRACRVGDCKLRLSSQMIDRFQKEVDWNSSDYATQATNLFRRIMLEYVQNYLARGDDGLIEYNDKREPVRLEDEQNSLLKQMIWINEYAPEFSDYLQNSSRAAPKNVSRSISWTKVKFGLKPVIILTETINYTNENNNGISQILSISKQLYASHYFDSSLGMTAVIKFPNVDKTPNSYLMYVNRGRTSSLNGAFSKITRGVIEREAIEKLIPLLQNTKYINENGIRSDAESNELSGNQQIPEWLLEPKNLLWFLIFSSAVVFVLWFGFKSQVKRGNK